MAAFAAVAAFFAAVVAIAFAVAAVAEYEAEVAAAVAEAGAAAEAAGAAADAGTRAMVQSLSCQLYCAHVTEEAEETKALRLHFQNVHVADQVAEKHSRGHRLQYQRNTSHWSLTMCASVEENSKRLLLEPEC